MPEINTNNQETRLSACLASRQGKHQKITNYQTPIIGNLVIDV